MNDVKAISKNFGRLDLSMDGTWVLSNAQRCEPRGYLWSKDALVWELQKLLKASGDQERAISRRPSCQSSLNFARRP